MPTTDDPFLTSSDGTSGQGSTTNQGTPSNQETPADTASDFNLGFETETPVAEEVSSPDTSSSEVDPFALATEEPKAESTPVSDDFSLDFGTPSASPSTPPAEEISEQSDTNVEQPENISTDLTEPTPLEQNGDDL